MTSIVNFEENLKDRKSNVILESLNRFHDAKISGAIRPDELSKIIVLVGDLFANKISKGEVSKEEIDETESFISQFTGENKDSYFDINHADLDKSSKMFLEGDFFALEKYQERLKNSSPLFDEESYSSGFKRL